MGRILVPESQAVNECLQLTEAPSDPPSSESVSGPVTICDTEPITSSVPTEVMINDQDSKIVELTKLVQVLMDEKFNFTKKIQESKYVIPQSESSKHNCVILVKGGVLAESSQSSESSIGVSCNTCESNVHSTTDHNDFEHFKRGEKIQSTKAKEPTKK
ncbi:hypothetical protein Tco_1163939 [Tanacetum coccineum]